MTDCRRPHRPCSPQQYGTPCTDGNTGILPSGAKSSRSDGHRRYLDCGYSRSFACVHYSWLRFLRHLHIG